MKRRRKTTVPVPTGESWTSGRYRSRVEYEVAGPITFDNADEIAAWCMAVAPDTEVQVRRDWPKRAVSICPNRYGVTWWSAGQFIAYRADRSDHERWSRPNLDQLELLEGAR